jgi:phosphoribosylanthranilate isomerase|tara:strand:+ start:5465 stop:6091 length:627 start_codon:yes stop_codon:yes gene_type:complete
MKAKVCGLSNATQVKACIEHGADYCGFIINYPKSHRFISIKTAQELTKIDKKNSKYVGVLVNPTNEELNKFSKLNFDYFQIYGNYNNEQIMKIKSVCNQKIIIALQIKSEKDVLNYKFFQDSADIILWDSSGLERSLSWNFDWMRSVPKNITKMIAGNIDINKLEKVHKLADIVDVSGALEIKKVKSITKIKKFLKAVKKINKYDKKK